MDKRLFMDELKVSATQFENKVESKGRINLLKKFNLKSRNSGLKCFGLRNICSELEWIDYFRLITEVTQKT